MLEVTGDLWTHPSDIVVISTNGIVRRDGHAVMGRGVARQAKDKFPMISKALGALIKKSGNHTYYLGAFMRNLPPKILEGSIVDSLARNEPVHIISLPVKHAWHRPAKIDLITRSIIELNYLCRIILPGAGIKSEVIALPRPGCGNGGLDWLKDVRSILCEILDDRFCVVERGK